MEEGVNVGERIRMESISEAVENETEITKVWEEKGERG